MSDRSTIPDESRIGDSGILACLPPCDPAAVYCFTLPAAAGIEHIGAWYSGEDAYEQNHAGILIREKTPAGWVTVLDAHEIDLGADYLTFDAWTPAGDLRLNGISGYFADRHFSLLLTRRDDRFVLESLPTPADQPS